MCGQFGVSGVDMFEFRRVEQLEIYMQIMWTGFQKLLDAQKNGSHDKYKSKYLKTHFLAAK